MLTCPSCGQENPEGFDDLAQEAIRLHELKGNIAAVALLEATPA
jgi:hypothetical protein